MSPSEAEVLLCVMLGWLLSIVCWRAIDCSRLVKLMASIALAAVITALLRQGIRALAS